jgi:hypothetical protein
MVTKYINFIQNIHVIADLALLILRQKMDRRPFTRKHSGTVYLPPKLYHQPDKGQDQLVDKTYLPMGFQLTKKNKFDALIAEEPEEEGVYIFLMFFKLKLISTLVFVIV